MEITQARTDHIGPAANPDQPVCAWDWQTSEDDIRQARQIWLWDGRCRNWEIFGVL